jgi:hypothetical protein
VYSLTLPESKAWSDFIHKIQTQFDIPPESQLKIYEYVGSGHGHGQEPEADDEEKAKQSMVDTSQLRMYDTENSNMQKIIHKTQLCIQVQSLHNSNSNSDSDNNSHSVANSHSNSNSKSDSDQIQRSIKMYHSMFQPQFGLDLDIFGRVPNVKANQNQRRKSRKKNKNSKAIFYHYHNYQNLNLDYIPKHVWLQLCAKPMTVTHIDQNYSIMRYTQTPITTQIETENNSNSTSNPNPNPNPNTYLSQFSLRTRRLIWPRNLQVSETDFKFNLNDIKTQWIWAVMLCHGGRFAGAIYHGTEMILHKTLQRYVVRGKQGKRQANHLSTSGVKAGSAGGYIRSHNESKLLIEIREILALWQEYLQFKCDKIFIHCPGAYNQTTFFGGSDEQQYLYPANNETLSDARLKDVMNKNKNKNRNLYRLQKKDERIMQIPMTTHTVTLKEVVRVHYWLSTCWLLKQ